jgi:hypothetical protein
MLFAVCHGLVLQRLRILSAADALIKDTTSAAARTSLPMILFRSRR